MNRVTRLPIISLLVLLFALCNWAPVATNAQTNSPDEVSRELEACLREEAQDGDNTSTETLYRIAVIYGYLGDYSAALTYIDRVITQEPLLAPPYALKGLIEYSLRNYEESYQSFYQYSAGTYIDALNGVLPAELVDDLVTSLYYLGYIRGYLLEEDSIFGYKFSSEQWFLFLAHLVDKGFITFQEYPDVISNTYLELASCSLVDKRPLGAEAFLKKLEACWEKFPEYDHTEQRRRMEDMLYYIEKTKE